MQGSADSIWSNTVLASYVYELMVKTPTLTLNPNPNPSPKPKPKPKPNPNPNPNQVKTPTPNTYAGYVEAAQGLSNLVVALPVGWAADKGSKVS